MCLKPKIQPGYNCLIKTCNTCHVCLVRTVKSMSKALRHFKIDPDLKIDETVYKQTESM